jgi:anaerobic selenocysteine-containing dehydrogenase
VGVSAQGGWGLLEALIPRGTADEWHRGVCRFCGTGCTVRIGMRGGKIVDVRPDQEGTNKGIICIKGCMLGDLPTLPGRLLVPRVRKGCKLVDVSWDEAMALVATRFREAIDKHGPDSVAFYGSGQLYTEESYTANKLFKAGIRTNNVDGNPRLCMASAALGKKTVSFAGFQKFLADYRPENVADLLGVSADQVRQAAFVFARSPATMSGWTMGVNQRTQGMALNTMLNALHLLTGQICRPGATPLSMTGTMTYKIPDLSRESGPATIELNDQDAFALGIKPGDRVEVRSRYGTLRGTAAVSSASRRGVAFAAFYGFQLLLNDVVADHVDPRPKEPEFKITAVSVRRLEEGR